MYTTLEIITSNAKRHLLGSPRGGPVYIRKATLVSERDLPMYEKGLENGYFRILITRLNKLHNGRDNNQIQELKR